MFISVEGIEGSGKTTQIENVAQFLKDNGKAVCVTKEPGGTDIGQKIRALLLSKDTVLKEPYSESLLFIADRMEHLAQVVEPALKRGEWVISDRYKDSTIAYQVGGRQLSKEKLASVESFINRETDLTLVLDLPVEEGLARAKNRSTLDRFEQESLDFHNRVRNEFLMQAKREPERVKVIEVSGKSKEAIFEEIKSIVGVYL